MCISFFSDVRLSITFTWSPSIQISSKYYFFFKYLGTDYYSTADTYEENNVFRFVSLFRNEFLSGDRVVVVSEYYNSCLLHELYYVPILLHFVVNCRYHFLEGFFFWNCSYIRKEWDFFEVSEKESLADCPAEGRLYEKARKRKDALLSSSSS